MGWAVIARRPRIWGPLGRERYVVVFLHTPAAIRRILAKVHSASEMPGDASAASVPEFSRRNSDDPPPCSTNSRKWKPKPTNHIPSRETSRLDHVGMSRSIPSVRNDAGGIGQSAIQGGIGNATEKRHRRRHRDEPEPARGGRSGDGVWRGCHPGCLIDGDQRHQGTSAIKPSIPALRLPALPRR